MDNSIADIFADPRLNFWQAFQDLGLENKAADMGIKAEDITRMKTFFGNLFKTDNPKASEHQQEMKVALEGFLQGNKAAQDHALLFWNCARVLTMCAGYRVNEDPSSDVNRAFNIEIPGKGYIVVDKFMGRNFIETEERFGILNFLDESQKQRLLVRVPLMFLCCEAHMMAPGQRKQDLFGLLTKLEEDNHLLGDNCTTPWDIEIPGDIALLFSPRTWLLPEFDANSYLGLAKKIAQQTISGGRLFLFNANTPENNGVKAEIEDGICKLTPTFTEDISEKIFQLFQDSDWEIVTHSGESINLGVLPQNDHKNNIYGLHVKKP